MALKSLSKADPGVYVHVTFKLGVVAYSINRASQALCVYCEIPWSHELDLLASLTKKQENMLKL